MVHVILEIKGAGLRVRVHILPDPDPASEIEPDPAVDPAVLHLRFDQI
jgi:hypothetical protein